MFMQVKANQNQLPISIRRMVNSPGITVGLCLFAALCSLLSSLCLALLFLSLSYIFIAFI